MPLCCRRAVVVLILLFAAIATAEPKAHTLTYAPGKTITLTLPDAFDINIAATGLRRVRFFAQAPDGRIFVTGMFDLSDNTRGSVFILDGWDEKTHTFTRVTHYLDHLRNPNNLAFWTDPATKQSWLYLPLTDKLVRYKYNAGDVKPASAPETLLRFPDYGLSYKYGGWHLTRTVAVAPVDGKPRVFVAVGSSCNYCQEKEVLRAAVVSMDPDGKNQKVVAQGLRNAVDLKFVPDLDGGSLFATNMGDDHLGAKLPEDTSFRVDPAPQNSLNYGWPKCYFAGGKAVLDATPLPIHTDAHVFAATPADLAAKDSVYGKQTGVATAGTNLAAGGGKSTGPDLNANLGKAPAPLESCKNVPPAYTTFAAHSSPLGLAYFGDADSALKQTFLVALHGASHPSIGSGYRVVRFSPSDHTPRDFITGFLTRTAGKSAVHGRPCGILRVGRDSFLLSDDYLGVVYFIHPLQ